MSHGITRKTLSAAVLGAAMAAGAAGTAAAADHQAASADNLTTTVADVQNMSVEDRVMGIPGDITRAAGAVHGTVERAAPQRSAEGLLGGLPLIGPLLEGAAGGLPTDSLTGGGLPTDSITGGGLPTGNLSGLPTSALGL
ncbi:MULTISPECIES: hypothetical protein [Streptomyces]|uniref:hypothetical protein n=1 Tax=Streptomyces TaxID=1883 RepID=UPI0022488069|nr:hypothetical protein [Streptomyces sp. JHD 1]MCX2969257.1 hypothetical protein [Streptomyces sp. JHD 1]